MKSAQTTRRPAASHPAPAFNAQAYLDSAGVAKRVARYRRGESIFAQGEPSDHIMYIRSGGVKLSVLSKAGREAELARLGPGDFFGEGCLAGQAIRMGSASATAPSVILLIARDRMVRLLHKQSAMSDRFISHMLARNVRIEEDLIAQLCNAREKRPPRRIT
jgi:CRP/FNR family cyclic AMP-dependent transcriptional regulator